MLNLGEFISTFLLISLGLGSGFVLPTTSSITVGLIWGSVIIIASLIGGFFGTTNMNPIFSLYQLLGEKIDFSQFFAQLSGQVLGALLAASLILSIFKRTNTLNINHFAAIASSDRRTFNFLIEFLGSFTLLFIIETIHAFLKNEQLALLTTGLCIAGLIALIGPITGASFNPARDFCPRLVFICYQKKKQEPTSFKNSLLSSNLAPIVAVLVFSFLLYR